MAENPIFSYTKRDYENSRKEGLAKIPIISSGVWTDLNSTDPGIIILDYVHALVDMVNYYQDHQALETFLTTAKERSNIFRLAKQLSYKIRSAKGATCDVTFTLSFQPYDHPILIPQYTRVRTREGIQYMTKEDAYLPAGETQVVIPCTQGTFAQETYIGTGISRFSLIEGASNQVMHLASANIDIDSILISEKDNAGRIIREWNPVDYIVFSKGDERVYQLDINPDDSVDIKFGDGVRGVVPQETNVLTIDYIITDAEEGKIGVGAITELLDSIYDNDNYVEFLVSNYQESYGGSKIQSSSEIKDMAPGVIKSQYRAVTLPDFEYLAKLVPGVADAKAYDLNTNLDLAYYEVEVLVVPDSSISDAHSLINDVHKFISPKMIPPTNLRVKTPNRLPLDLEIVVKKYDNSSTDRLEYLVHQKVIEYFTSRSTAVGESFYPSDLVSIVKNIEGVRNVVSTTIKYIDPLRNELIVDSDYSNLKIPMNYVIVLGNSKETIQ